MTKQQKITLSASRDIPFNTLMLSQSNVRHVKAGVSIEELAEDIARRTLLISITVRPVLDENGAETGMYTIPAGGRRFRALELLVKQKRMNKTVLVPCIVRTDGLAEEDSLAENVQRAPLRPLDDIRVPGDAHAGGGPGRSESCHSFNGSVVPLCRHSVNRNAARCTNGWNAKAALRRQVLWQRSAKGRSGRPLIGTPWLQADRDSPFWA